MRKYKIWYIILLFCGIVGLCFYLLTIFNSTSKTKIPQPESNNQIQITFTNKYNMQLAPGVNLPRPILLQTNASGETLWQVLYESNFCFGRVQAINQNTLNKKVVNSLTLPLVFNKQYVRQYDSSRVTKDLLLSWTIPSRLVSYLTLILHDKESLLEKQIMIDNYLSGADKKYKAILWLAIY